MQEIAPAIKAILCFVVGAILLFFSFFYGFTSPNPVLPLLALLCNVSFIGFISSSKQELRYNTLWGGFFYFYVALMSLFEAFHGVQDKSLLPFALILISVVGPSLIYKILDK